MDSKVYFGGITTTPDVNKLLEEYTKDKLVPNYEIPYKDVEIITGAKYGTSRWDSVTNRWRKKLENLYNIIIGCKDGSKSFIVLNEKGKLNLSGKKMQMATKSLKRSIVVAHTIDRKALTTEEAKELDFIKDKSAKMVAINQIKSNVELPQLGG